MGPKESLSVRDGVKALLHAEISENRLEGCLGHLRANVDNDHSPNDGSPLSDM